MDYFSPTGTLYSTRNTMKLRKSFSNMIVLMIVVLILIVVHELIHGINYGFFVKDKHSIEFGIQLPRLTASCTSSEPLSRGQYMLACIMPCQLLGGIPFIVAIIIGSPFLISFGIIIVLVQMDT